MKLWTRSGVLDEKVGNDQALLRFCKGFNGWCCDTSDSTIDCCSEGVGFQWNNATSINYDLIRQQADHSFYSDGACTTVAASTVGTTTSRTTVSGTQQTVAPTPVAMPTDASSAFSACPTDTCPSTPSVALEAGFAVRLRRSPACATCCVALDACKAEISQAEIYKQVESGQRLGRAESEANAASAGCVAARACWWLAQVGKA
ncbi:hypothetical protein PG994_004289 [Apiospora phragmitis]|uniref:Uncharacterized protein n=1 Tax=Apiospora phragmitis TaxID=2905665 RepID=A0ABR1VQ72_9PEZI